MYTFWSWYFPYQEADLFLTHVSSAPIVPGKGTGWLQALEGSAHDERRCWEGGRRGSPPFLILVTCEKRKNGKGKQVHGETYYYASHLAKVLEGRASREDRKGRSHCSTFHLERTSHRWPPPPTEISRQGPAFDSLKPSSVSIWHRMGSWIHLQLFRNELAVG